MQTAEELAEYGIPRECIPTSHGGKWTFDRAMEWEQQVEADWAMEEVQKTTGNRSINECSTISKDSGDDDSRDGTKTTNAVYCRRAYHKRKQNESQLKKKLESLNAEHVALVDEEHRLQNLLEAALKLIASQEGR